MKILKYLIITLIICGILFATAYFIKTNSKSITNYETESPFISSIEEKTVVTGKVIPEDEVEIKPQISGIVDRIYLEEGDLVQKGDLIAKIRVVPNEQALASAKSRIKTTKFTYENNKTLFQRNKALYEKGVISRQDFETTELNLNQSKENFLQARNDYQIIKQGSISVGGMANTNIVSQISGTILQIPVREGDQVIESNNFNAGTTIATVADMSKMIFEGKVDESEVAKLEEGTEIKVVLGAINEMEFPAKLTFVAPKGIEENGAVQFTIKADVEVAKGYKIRAGYSANAEIEVVSKDSVMVIKESLLQFNRFTEKPFVEVQDDKGNYTDRDVEIGISDGINIEILNGLELSDNIKVWNKVIDEDNLDEEEKKD